METTLTITEDQKRQYRDEGYFVLDRVIPQDQLEMLREKCEDAMERTRLRLEARGTEYDVSSQQVDIPYGESQDLDAFLHDELMAEVCRATLGPDAYLSNQFFVVKLNERKHKWSWHQDAQYGVDRPVPPYVVCWIALDDVGEENGTIHVLPFSRAGTRGHIEHRVDRESGEWIGYDGDDPGDPMTIPAGSIVVFSGYTLHRSGPNTTSRPRRTYTVRYTSAPVDHPDAIDELFLKDGVRVTS